MDVVTGDGVEPIMRRVFAGTDIDQLQPAELETLARWAAKTAITLSYATPQHAPVPLLASRSLHPAGHEPPRFGFFYSKISADGPSRQRAPASRVQRGDPRSCGRKR